MGDKEVGPLHLEHWQGAPLVLDIKGKDVVVVSTTAETKPNGKPLAVGQVVPFGVFGKDYFARNWITNSSIGLHLAPTGDGPYLQAFDGQSEPIRTLHALDWYPPTPKYRIPAKWVPVSGERQVTAHRTKGASNVTETVSGYVQFKIDGQKLLLYATSYPDLPIHIIFRDLTSKTETYPASASCT